MKHLTKRQRKALNGPNAMSQRSLKYGKNIQIGDVMYRGSHNLPFVRANVLN